MARFVGLVDELRPALDTIAVWVRRTVWIPYLGFLDLDLPPMPSSKRNTAVLTLMPGVDKEWVVWTPKGYYDTSIEGDWRFLGWHINAEFRSPRPTDFVVIGTYAKTMLQPSVLDRLWKVGNLEQALQAELPARTPPPEVPAYENRPPRILFTSVEGGIRLPAPGVIWVVNVPNPRLGFSIQAEGKSRIGTRRVVFDERVLELPPIGEPKPAIAENLQVTLFPQRRVRLAVEAANESGSKRIETMDMVYMPPDDAPPVPKIEPRLIVVSVGVEQTQNAALLPAIAFADKDAAALTDFLSDHLVSPDGAPTVQDRHNDRVTLTANKAFARSVRQTLDQLEQRLQAKQLHKGDIVALVITSHLLEFDRGARIATPDTNPERKPIPSPMILARDVSDLLGRLTDYGCRVIVFLDGVHELTENAFKSDIKSWVRELQRERRVITFVASKEGPSGVDKTKEHGLFALGILDVFQGAGAAAARKDRKATFTLEQFRRALRQEVQDLSGRNQEADAFIPFEIDPRTRFVQP
jgi:hypothetical protein